MAMCNLTLSRGAISITFSVEALGDDVCVTVTGGSRPHIGAVALSMARPSLTGDGSVSASTSVITMLGHKDDVVAKYVSEQFAKRLNRNAAAVCGIHYDEITPSDIKTVLDLASEGTRQICSMLLGELTGMPVPGEPG
ncbi:MAG: hypothetical protein LBT08_04985 [Synergistaceae bacterium]|jgi:hypothetical protein|nr:hypothetical protein [Synergistaceae bacterium]